MTDEKLMTKQKALSILKKEGENWLGYKKRNVEAVEKTIALIDEVVSRVPDEIIDHCSNCDILESLISFTLPYSFELISRVEELMLENDFELMYKTNRNDYTRNDYTNRYYLKYRLKMPDGSYLRYKISDGSENCVMVKVGFDLFHSQATCVLNKIGEKQVTEEIFEVICEDGAAEEIISRKKPEMSS